MGVFVQFSAPARWNFRPRRTAVLEIREADAEDRLSADKKPLAEVLTADREGLDSGPFSLAPLKPGYYSAEVSLLDGSGQKVLSARENFVLLSQASPVLPWVYSKGHPAFPNAGRLLRRHGVLPDQPIRQSPAIGRAGPQAQGDASTRLLLAKVLYALGRYQGLGRCPQPPKPPADARRPRSWRPATRPQGLGVGRRLSREAHGRSHRSERPEPGGGVLSSPRPARKGASLLQKSLEIDPNQPAVKALLERARAGIK